MKSKTFLIFCLFIFACPGYCHAKTILSFEGQLDFSKQEFDFNLNFGDRGTLDAAVEKKTKGKYDFVIKANHLKTPSFDLSSQLDGLIETNVSKDVVDGKIWSQYSLVDYKPIRELSGRFELRNQRLYILSLSFGNIACQGYVGLTQPYDLDLDFRLASVEMEDFLRFWMGKNGYDSDGVVSGEIRLLGIPEALTLKGDLETSEGFVSKLVYNRLFLRLEGTYPQMQIANSTVFQQDGMSFTFEGPINISDRENFKSQIKELNLSPLVSGSASEVEWTIKRLKQEGKGTTELKYQFRKDGYGGLSAEDDIDMIGIEKKKEF